MVDSSSRVGWGRRAPRAWVLALVALTISCGEGPTQPVPASLRITCPAGVEGQSPDGQPVSVTFSSPTTSGGVAPVSLTCTPQSGSLFPGGTTTVSCSARDSRGVSAACSLPVFVRLPPRLLGGGRVLAFGDSITNGQEGGGQVSPFSIIGSTLAPFAYPNVLEPLLTDRYRTQTPVVIASGRSGEFATEGVLRLPLVLDAMRPDILLLMEGTNDLLFLSAGVADATVALRVMVQQAKSRSIRVLLSTVPPQRAGGLRNRDLFAGFVPILNEQIRQIATSENVPLVDMYDVFIKDMTLIGTDDLHPTPRGFRVMAETWFEAIKLHSEQPQPALGIQR